MFKPTPQVTKCYGRKKVEESNPFSFISRRSSSNDWENNSNALNQTRQIDNNIVDETKTQRTISGINLVNNINDKNSNNNRKKHNNNDFSTTANETTRRAKDVKSLYANLTSDDLDKLKELTSGDYKDNFVLDSYKCKCILRPSYILLTYLLITNHLGLYTYSSCRRYEDLQAST